MSNVVVTYGADIIERTITALEMLNPSLPRKHSKIVIKPNLVEPMSKDPGAVTISCDLVGADLLGYKNVFYLDLALRKGLGKPPSTVKAIGK